MNSPSSWTRRSARRITSTRYLRHGTAVIPADQIEVRSSMPESSLLTGLRDELVRLAAHFVQANDRVDTVRSRSRQSTGSAWLYADLVWVDKHHSVSDARGKVTLTNGTQRLLGEVIGKDPDTDLAVIRADHTLEVKPLVLRTSPARLGELCFALGAPLGEFADTMSMGIVSGLNRRLAQGQGRVIEDVLQTDAAINHGNSGGPLVDIDGSILGVNTAGIDDAHNIGFAVPSHTVADIVPELLEAGAITRATIGAKLEIRRAASSGADELVVLETVDESSPLRA